MTKAIQLIFMKKSQQKNHVIELLLIIILLLCVTPLHSETNYLFPSDIIDQAELTTYKDSRDNIYTSQPYWIYPMDIRKDEQLNAQKYYYTNRNNYTTIDRQALSDQSQPNYGSSWYTGSNRYKYSDLHLNQPLDYQQANKIAGHVLYVSDAYRNPVKEHTNIFGSRIYEQSIGIESITTPANTDEQYKQMYPNLLYASDLEPSRRLINQKHKTMRYKFQSHSRKPQTRELNRYISAPRYSMPRTLPGIVPGVTTSRYRPLGYSHLYPNYSYGGLNNKPGTPYNPLIGFGIFQGQ